MLSDSSGVRTSATGWALFSFACMLAIGLFLTGWEEGIDAVRTLSLLQFLALCGLALAHYVIRAIRWHIMVRTAGLVLPVTTSLLHFFAGFAMTATPGRVGELVRLRWLMRATGRGFGHLLPIAFADRAIELASMVGLIALCLTAANLNSTAVFVVLATGFVLTWIVCRPAALLIFVNALWRLLRIKPRIFVKLRRLTRRLEPFLRARIFFPVLCLGMVGWALEGVAFHALLGWLGADIALPTAAAIFLIAILSGALSGLPGGLGGTEATAITLLALQGVSFETAVLATAIIRVATLWFAVGIGFLFFPLAEVRR